jgi:hypothetical protein
MTVPIPEGSVIITPAQVYDKVNALTDAVTELLARDKADQETARRRDTEDRERESDRKAQVKAIELRLTAVERKVYVASGFAAAIGGVLGGWLPSVLGR